MRRVVFALAMSVALAGCGGASTDGNFDAVDINAAADAAQGSIDTYAANALEAPPVRAAPAAVPVPEPGNTIDAETATVADDATAAGAVVRQYYAAIGTGRYRDAWSLWEQDGAASGMDAEAFSASFARFADYHATVGTPGRVDAGAGQRYVTVPVTVAGTLKDGGRPFTMAGTVTLHHVAEIDGASAAQKSWHIRSIDVKPLPATP